ncbi:hypothetical protein [Spartinivicinus ruber]|uniref:hypothetical protein n=1 Tax=Spartinivicinus ruber TaxID=2683272 RepID=UPI0013D82F68|nr:hypothetical protein [Spartinivicinus ruber]
MDELIAFIREIEINQNIAVLSVLGFGVFAIIQIFNHMKKDFGVFNIRITGIVIVATFSTILAVLNPSTDNAAIGILGAIVGYLFGYGVPAEKKQKTEPIIDHKPIDYL